MGWEDACAHLDWEESLAIHLQCTCPFVPSFELPTNESVVSRKNFSHVHVHCPILRVILGRFV